MLSLSDKNSLKISYCFGLYLLSFIQNFDVVFVVVTAAAALQSFIFSSYIRL